MRRTDEILAAFPNQSANGRRYLLRCLERQSITPDAPVFLALVREGEAEERVADWARLVEDGLYARVVRDRALRASGNPTEEAGEWSRFLGQAELRGGDEGVSRVERNGAAVLAALVPSLRQVLSMAGPPAEEALRVLARIRTHSSLEAILGAATLEPLLPRVFSALAVMGGEAASAAALELLKARPELLRGRPGVLVALRGLASRTTFGLLVRAARDPERLPAVATAMEAFGDFDYKQILKPALLSGDPWTMMHAIESLGRMGGETRARELCALHEKLEHPMVRVACLQALSSTGSPDAAPGALASLEDDRPLVQAAGIEALINLPIPQKEYRDRVLGLLDSEHPRLAMAASMACVVLEPRRAARRIGELMRSRDAAQLMQGIHCLAYLEHPATSGLLRALVENSPSGPLRSQGIWALGRRAAYNAAAAEDLTGFLGSEDPDVRRTAAWFLSSAMPAARADGVEAIERALPGEADPDVAAAYLEAIGMAGPTGGGNPSVVGQLLRHRDPGVRRAAAWALVTAFPESDEAEELEAGAAPGAAPWGCVRRWFLEAGGVERMADQLARLDPSELLVSLKAARYMAEAPSFAANADRLQGLGAALEAMDLGDGPAPSQEDETPSPPSVEAFRHRPYRPAPSTMQEHPPQVVESLEESALPTAEDAGTFLGAGGPTAEDATEAAVKVSLFTLDKESVEEMVRAQEAAARREDEVAVLKVLLYLSSAVLLGQLARWWYFFG